MRDIFVQLVEQSDIFFPARRAFKFICLCAQKGKRIFWMPRQKPAHNQAQSVQSLPKLLHLHIQASDMFRSLPLPAQSAPSKSVSVMDATFVQRLAAANALTRKLRGWQIGVEAVVIPQSHENAPAMLYIRPNPARSARQLLDATAGSRRWLPASGRLPDRLVAELDGCMVMWILRDRRTLLRRTAWGHA